MEKLDAISTIRSYLMLHGHVAIFDGGNFLI